MGHAPVPLSCAQLLAYFWKTIDPAVKDRQFCDLGTPCRTAIFAVTPTQLQTARDSLAALAQSKPFAEPIQTQVVMLDDFDPAEDEHQNYHQNNPVRDDHDRSSCGRDARLKQLWGSPATPPIIYEKSGCSPFGISARHYAKHSALREPDGRLLAQCAHVSHGQRRHVDDAAHGA